MDDLFSDYDRSLSNSDMMLPGGSGIRDVQDELGFGLGGLDDSNSSSRYDQLNGLNGGLTLSPPANDHLSDNGSTGGMIDNYNLESSKPVFDDLGSYDGVHLMDEQSNALLNDPLLSCSLDPDLEAHNASLLALIQPFEIVLPRPPARIMEALEKAEAKEAKARRRAQSLAERKKTKTRYAREVPCAVCGENGTSEMPANSQYCSTHCILDMVAKCRKICKPTDGIAFVDHLGTVIQMPPKHQVTIDKLEAFLRSKPTMKPFVNFAILETMDKQTESQQMLEAAKTIKSIDQIRNECKCNMVTRLMQCAKIHNVPVSRKKVKNLSDQIEAELFKQAKGVVKCKLYRNWITNFFSQIVNTQNHFSKAVLNCTYTAQKLVIMTKAEMFVDPNAAPEQVAKPQKPTVKQSSKNRSAGYCAVDSILGAEDADTTSQHHSHVFDSKCQICALKLKEQQEAEKLAIKSKLEELEERKRRKELNQQRLKEKEERRKAEEAMKREMPQMDDFDDFSQDHIPLSSRHDDGFDLVERSPSPVYDRRGPPSGYVRRGESRFEPLDRNRRLSPRDNYDYDRDRRPDDNNWRRDEPRFDEDDDFDAMDRATSSSHLLATPPPGVSPERIAICRVGVRPTSPSVPSKRHRPNMPQADVGPLDEDEFAPNAWIGVRPIGRQVKPVWPTREIQSAGFTGNSSFGPRNSSMPMNPAGNDSWRKQEQWRKSSEGAGFPRPGGGFHPMKAVSPQSPAFAIYSPASTSVHTATPPQRNAQHVREASPEPLKPEPSYDQRLWNRSHVIWKGRILGETFDFCCTMSAISNPCAFDLIGRIPNPMNLIARVKPEAMWEFMHIIRKQASRYQIILSVIHPEQGLADGFYMCYHNLKKSRRYAVLDMKDANIKEAYLFYIDVNEPLPKVLLPIDGPGLPETTKASMCIVIIRYKDGVLPHNGTGAAASSSQKAASPPPTSSVSTPSQPTKSMTPGGQVLSMENVLLRIKQATTPGELIAIVKDFVAKNNMSKADKSYLEEVCRKEIAMRKKGPVAKKAPEPPAPAPGSAPGPPPVVPQLLPPLRPPPVPQPQPLLRSAPPVIPQLIISAVNNNVKDDGELQEPSSTNDTVIASTETQSPDTGGGEPMDIDEAVPPPRPVSKQRSEVSSLEAGEMRDSSDDENMEICDDDDDRSASESLTVLLPPPPPPPASSLLNPPPPPPPPPPPAPTLPPTTTSNAMPHAAQQPPTHRLPSLLENPTPRYNFNYDTSPSYRPPPMMQRPPGPGYGPSPPRPPPRYAPSQFFPSPPKPSYYPRNSYAPPPYEGPYRGMAPRGFRGGRGGGGGPMDGYGMGRPPLRPPFGRGGGRPPFGARGGGFPRPMGMMRPPPE